MSTERIRGYLAKQHKARAILRFHDTKQGKAKIQQLLPHRQECLWYIVAQTFLSVLRGNLIHGFRPAKATPAYLFCVLCVPCGCNFPSLRVLSVLRNFSGAGG